MNGSNLQNCQKVKTARKQNAILQLVVKRLFNGSFQHNHLLQYHNMKRRYYVSIQLL